MWLTEQMRYEPDTGRLLTHDTWEYKVPSSKDIPQDFRYLNHKIYLSLAQHYFAQH